MPEPLSLRLHPRAAEWVARRAAVLAALRRHLDGSGLLEADVPPLAPFAGQEPFLHPPPASPDGFPGPLWLQTSPELLLKRLVCAGAGAVYSLAHAFRGGPEELSERHQPAFLMLEWYRPGARVELLQDDVAALAAVAAAALGVPPPAPPRSLTVAEALRRFAGVDAAALFDDDGPAFAAALRAAGVPGGSDGDDAAALLARVVVDRVEPGLRREGGLTFLRDWPACAAALARRSERDPRLALRVEAYLDGIELANGWVELTDAEELARRWEQDARRRVGPAPELDRGLLALMRRRPMPDTVGMALGVDRLIAALVGAETLGEVLPLSLARTGARPARPAGDDGPA